MEQRTLQIGDRVIYCYEDGSVEYLCCSSCLQPELLKRTSGSSKSEGYMMIRIKINGKLTTLSVHRLIALAFHANPNNLPEVDHINRNKCDNKSENLRWVSHKANADNQKSVDISLSKYGIRRSEDPKEYYKALGKDYRSKIFRLRAIQPSGKQTSYVFHSKDDPLYIILRSLSQKDRYFKYQELRGKHV